MIKRLVQLLGFTLMVLGLSSCKKDCAPNINSDCNDYINMPLEVCSNDVSVFDEDVEAFVLEEDGGENLFEASGIRVAYDTEPHVQDFTLEQLDEKDEMHIVYFPYDSKEVRPDQHTSLRLLAKDAHKIYRSGRAVCCKGHSCEWHGTDVYNIALSENRARTIAQYLEKEAGIPRSYIKVFGVGNDEPVTRENSREAQAPNRRVEVYAVAA